MTTPHPGIAVDARSRGVQIVASACRRRLNPAERDPLARGAEYARRATDRQTVLIRWWTVVVEVATLVNVVLFAWTIVRPN